MARLPAGAEVLITPGLWVPLVALRSVYVLPGIPRLFRAMLEAHLGRFRGPQAHAAALWTNIGEGELAWTACSLACFLDLTGVAGLGFPGLDSPKKNRTAHEIGACLRECCGSAAAKRVRRPPGLVSPRVPSPLPIPAFP